MLVESWVIVVIIAATGIISLRMGRKNFGISVFVLTLVPLAYIVSSPISRLLSSSFGADPIAVRIIMIVLMLAATCLIVALLAPKDMVRKLKFMYLAVCTGYSAILTAVYLIDIIL